MPLNWKWTPTRNNYTAENTKQTVKSKSWSKSSGTCSSPQFLRWSIHCRRFLSTQSFATLILTGTTPLAAMDCCSSVTDAPKWLDFFRLSDSLFSLADLKEEFSRRGLQLQLFASSPFHCKNARQSWMASANHLADDTMEPSYIARWRNGTKLQMTQSEKWKTRTVSRPPAQVTLYHLKWARSALRDLWLEVWGLSCW